MRMAAQAVLAASTTFIFGTGNAYDGSSLADYFKRVEKPGMAVQSTSSLSSVNSGCS